MTCSCPVLPLLLAHPEEPEAVPVGTRDGLRHRRKGAEFPALPVITVPQHSDGVFDPVTTNVAQLKAGSLRALGVSTPARLPAFPNIPTFAEQGFPSIVGMPMLLP